MSQLIRLVYASRSTFAPSAAHQGLDPSVARILAKSRKNNATLGIVGGLLFGDGCFLQCLEGNADAVDALYERIKSDPRHRDVTVLSRSPVVRTSFGAWSMKYAPGEAPLRRLMQSLGMSRFDPYGMSPQNIEAAVAYMEREAELAPTAQGKQTDRSDPPARTAPVSFIDSFKTGRLASQNGSPVDARPGAGKAVKVITGMVITAALLGWAYWSLRA
ncbi:MAG: BLUF domain-containing protein [Rhizobacter sp.]|nr:BLUF domain-containing protein [Rhizobacter sp.]